MPRRIDMGTDIGQVGIWDPGHDYPERPAAYRDYTAALQAQAEAGQLFYVNTGGDGGVETDIYIDEQPDPETLKLYRSPAHSFLIESHSGRLIAGGLEDFANPNTQITSAEDELTITPGQYALRFFELDDEKYQSRLSAHINDEDMAYYAKRVDRGCTTGCLLFVGALVMAAVSWVLSDVYPWLWAAPAALIVLGISYITIRTRSLAQDTRYQDIAQRIAAFEASCPGFIIVITALQPGEQAQGGWHTLD